MVNLKRAVGPCHFKGKIDEIVKNQRARDVQLTTALVDTTEYNYREAKPFNERLDRRVRVLIVTCNEHHTPPALIDCIAGQRGGRRLVERLDDR